jgi:multiple sugar transport system substrate-binding protein
MCVFVFFAVLFIVRNAGNVGGTGGSSDKITLQVWGVFDDRSAFDEAIKSFEKANPAIHAVYRNVDYATYEKTVIDALAANQGPDIWMMHHTWLAKHQNKLAPLPESFPGRTEPLMTLRQYQEKFVDVASTDLVRDGKIYGMPLYIDTLALYYNKSLLASAGIATPPETWADMLEQVTKLTRRDANDTITLAGAALGTARNVNRSTDILMMLMLQSGVQMTDDAHTSATFSRSVDGQAVGERSLQFYTDFANPRQEVYTYNDSQDYSIDAFVAGKAAMMINYSHQIPVLQSRAPRLDWGVAPVPQATTVSARTYANYWPLVVSASTQHPNEAWALVYHLAAGDGTISYLNASNRPAARRDLIKQQQNDPLLGVFAQQALTARSWYQVDSSAIEKIFADMIDAVNLKRVSPRDALRDAETKASLLMRR